MLERITNAATETRASRPANAGQIDRLLGDAMMWSEASDPARARPALAEIESKIVKLARKVAQ